jgi:hypothetical protein
VKGKLPFLLIALCVFASLAGPAASNETPARYSSKAPVIMLKCPDIAVTGMNVTLVSTLLGDPQVEFPLDTVRLEATLENVGTEAVPAGTFIYLILKRNGEVVRSATVTDTLGAPGSSWTYSVNDSFLHGHKTTYVLQASSPLKECRLSNNLAALTIDEKKLHPQGDPDLSVAVFSVEKRWRQDGERFKASFQLAADMTNGGAGFATSASRLLFLINGNQELAALKIAQDDLPGPGQKRRFTVSVGADKIPLGDHVVQASIEPPHNERNIQNNLSHNSGQISNSAELPAGVLAALEFTPWRLSGKNLSTRIKMSNLQSLSLKKLRLILFRDGKAVKEWRDLSFTPRETFLIGYEEELAPPQAIFGQNRFRALLTSDRKGEPPENNSILDECTRDICWVELDEGTLQNSLRNRETGLAVQASRKHGDCVIRETHVGISAGGIAIRVKGSRAGEGSSAAEFSAELILSPRLTAGRVYFETLKADVQVSSGPSDFFPTQLAPIIYRSVKAAIENFAEKELAVNLPPTTDPAGRKNQYGPPLGIVLVDGALDLYY